MSALSRRIMRIMGIMLSGQRQRENNLDIFEGQFRPIWLEVNEIELDGRRGGQSGREF